MPSKKQSAAKPPDETVFFIDRSLGVEPIRTEFVNTGLVVQIHDDHFARDAEDRVWLRTVGERGWVVLTKDQRLRYRPLEIAALRASKARVFVLTAGNLRGIEIAAVFLTALPRIFKVLHSVPGPFVARVSQSGHVKVLKKISPGDPPRVMGDQYAGRSKVTELLGPEFWSLIGPSTTVIDFGCGSGRHAVEIAKAGPELVLGVDICDLSEARELAAHEGVSDTCRFQAYADRQADVIVCLDSFEHFADPEDVLNHMIGLLKPGGRITISFGWTWYHPLGGHLFSVFPWAHLLFSETALIRWRSDLRGDGARRFAEVEGGLNRMTIHRFESMARRCGLLVEHFRCVPIRKLARLHCHLTREFTTATVRCVLRARAIAV